MNHSRTGKIARLPKSIRNELDRRLDDGEPYTPLVAWLNDQPEVQAILQKYFAGSPIKRQNVSNWKSGGHQDTLRQAETLQVGTQLLEESKAVDEISGKPITEHFATMIALEMVRFSRDMRVAKLSTNERWKRVCQLNDQFSRLRRGDCDAALNRLKSEQLHHRIVTGEREEKLRLGEQRRKELLIAMQAGMQLASISDVSQSNPAQGNASPRP